MDSVFQTRKGGKVIGMNGQKVKPRATAHRAEINNIFLVFAVAESRSKQMLDRMHGCGREIISAVRFFETKIERCYILQQCGKYIPGIKTL